MNNSVESAKKKNCVPKAKKKYFLATYTPSGGIFSYTMLNDILPESDCGKILADSGKPIKNLFRSSIEALKAARLIPKYCANNEVCIISVSARITVKKRTQISVRLGE